MSLLTNKRKHDGTSVSSDNEIYLSSEDVIQEQLKKYNNLQTHNNNNSTQNNYNNTTLSQTNEILNNMIFFQEKCFQQIYILIEENNKKFERYAEDTKNAFDKCMIRLECLEKKVSTIYEEKDAIINSLENEKKEMIEYLEKNKLFQKTNDYFV